MADGLKNFKLVFFFFFNSRPQQMCDVSSVIGASS